METPISIFKGSEYYLKMINSFSEGGKLNFDLKSNEISKAIFYHTCKMKYAGWRMRINFKRFKRHSLADYFQDIVAFYLKACLPKEYEVVVESRNNNLVADIAIKYQGQNCFVFEIKTNIGWDRKGPEKTFALRMEELAKNFEIPIKNILYVFEDHVNVSREFSAKYWDKYKGAANPPPVEFPYSHIKPLFSHNDPYYWKYEKGFKKELEYKEFDDDFILQKAENSIVTKFEDIISQILEASNMIIPSMKYL